MNEKIPRKKLSSSGNWRKTVGYVKSELGLKGPKRKWEETEISLIKEKYYEIGSKEISKILVRSAQAVEMKAREIGLKIKGINWNEEMDNYLKENYTKKHTKEISEFLDKSLNAVRIRARIIGCELKIKGVRKCPIKSSKEYKDKKEKNMHTKDSFI